MKEFLIFTAVALMSFSLVSLVAGLICNWYIRSLERKIKKDQEMLERMHRGERVSFKEFIDNAL